MHAPGVSLHEPVNEWNGPSTGGNVRDVTGGLSSNVRDVMNMKWRVALSGVFLWMEQVIGIYCDVRLTQILPV